MAFLFALTGHAIQIGGGAVDIRQQACALLQMRISKRMIELEPYDRNQLLERRYLEYGAKFNIKDGVTLATLYFGSLTHGGPSTSSLIDAAKGAHLKASLAWSASVRAGRLYLDKERMVQEFAE